ncbi:MAG: hypothetical protein NVS9B4_00220 [Candidatus Acidiferrum sp.]
MSECNVCIGFEDYDGTTEFFEVTEHKARKAHRCAECRREIPIGERYQATSIKFDGDFSYTKTCLICADVYAVYSCGNSLMIGELWSEMRDYVFPNLTTASKCFKELSVVSKSRVLEEWRKWKGL